MKNELRYVGPLLLALCSAAQAEEHGSGVGASQAETIPFRRQTDDGTFGRGIRYLPKVTCEMQVIRYKVAKEFHALVPISIKSVEKEVKVKIPKGGGRRFSYLGSTELIVDGHKYGVSLRANGDPDFSKNMPVRIGLRAYASESEVLGHEAASFLSTPSKEEDVASFTKEMDGYTDNPVKTSIKCRHESAEEF